MPSTITTMAAKEHYVYILRCSDSTLYTGLTTEPERRYEEHRSRGKKCAKYTYAHPVVCMEALWKTEDKVQAAKLESKIKALARDKKLRLIAGDEALICGVEGCERVIVPEKLKKETVNE